MSDRADKLAADLEQRAIRAVVDSWRDKSARPATIQLKSPVLSWHLHSSGQYRVVAVYWGTHDVAARLAWSGDTLRDAWRGAVAVIAPKLADDQDAYRALVMLGAVSHRSIHHQ